MGRCCEILTRERREHERSDSRGAHMPGRAELEVDYRLCQRYMNLYGTWMGHSMTSVEFSVCGWDATQFGVGAFGGPLSVRHPDLVLIGSRYRAMSCWTGAQDTPFTR